MSAGAAITRSWSVGKFNVTMTIPRESRGVACAVIEWAPHMPKRRLTDAELQEYRAGRGAALADIADELGITVGIVDL